MFDYRFDTDRFVIVVRIKEIYVTRVSPRRATVTFDAWWFWWISFIASFCFVSFIWLIWRFLSNRIFTYILCDRSTHDSLKVRMLCDIFEICYAFWLWYFLLFLSDFLLKFRIKNLEIDDLTIYYFVDTEDDMRAFESWSNVFDERWRDWLSIFSMLNKLFDIFCCLIEVSNVASEDLSVCSSLERSLNDFY